MVRGLFSWGLIPLTLLVAVGSNALLVTRFDPEASSVAAGVLATLLVGVAQWVNPYTARWRESWGNLSLDWAFLLLSAVLLPSMQQGVLWLLRRLGSVEVWPQQWPMVGQVVLALLLIELVQYSTHRLLHTNAFLWGFHAIHHSPERLQLWCSFRNHPVDTLLTVALPVAPLAWLGVSPVVVSYCVAIVAANATLQHANAGVREGVWSWLIATPGIHRRHHVREAHDAQCNFGGFLLVWDLLLRTRRPPPEDVPSLGIEGAVLPKTLLGQLWAPFSRLMQRAPGRTP